MLGLQVILDAYKIWRSLVSVKQSQYAIQEQPNPSGDGTAVWDLVIKDMRSRDQIGRERYGTPLQTHNGRDGLVDAYQEVLDLAVYLRQELEERVLINDVYRALEEIPGIDACNSANVLTVIEGLTDRVASQSDVIKQQSKLIETFQKSGTYDTGFSRGCQFVLDAFERHTGQRMPNVVLDDLMETQEMRNVLKG